MDVVLIRHTAVQAERGTCYGRQDVPLAEPLAPAFERAAQPLPALDAVFTSPLQRCAQLATWLAARHGAPLHTDPRWQELDFGQWEGRSWHDIGREHRPLLDRWALDPGSFVAPGGESVHGLHLRVQVALQGLREQALRAGWQRVAVVTHGGPIRVLLAHAMGLGLAKVNALEVPFGHAFALRRTPRDASWQRTTLDAVRAEAASVQPAVDDDTAACAP